MPGVGAAALWLSALAAKGAPSSISVPRAALPGRALPDTALALSIALNERQSMAFPLGLRFKAIIARFSAKQTKFSTAGTRSMSLPATRLTTRVELFYCRGPTSGRMRPRPLPGHHRRRNPPLKTASSARNAISCMSRAQHCEAIVSFRSKGGNVHHLC